MGPIISALVDFRDEVRATAKSSAPPLKSLLELCDRMRDQTMVDLGVRVEDRAEKALWSLADPSVMRKEMQAKLAAAMEAQVSKLLNKLTTKKAELSKHEANAVPPKDFFSQPQFAGTPRAPTPEARQPLPHTLAPHTLAPHIPAQRTPSHCTYMHSAHPRTAHTCTAHTHSPYSTPKENPKSKPTPKPNPEPEPDLDPGRKPGPDPDLAGKYSALDAEGKPTADAAGAELNKNQKKDADKLWAKQDKEHTKYKEALAKTPSLLEDLRGAIGGLREEVSGLLRQHGANLGDELQQKLTGALS